MADIDNYLEEMAPLERLPSHSADPAPKIELEVPAEALDAKSCQQRRSFQAIPTGPPGSGARYRQSQSNPKPYKVLIPSPILDESESEAAALNASCSDIDPLSLTSSNDDEISPTSGRICQSISAEYRKQTLSQFGSHRRPTASANRESIEKDAGYVTLADEGFSKENSCTNITDKGKSRESSGTGPSWTGPGTPAPGSLEFQDNPVAVKHVSIPSSHSDQGSFPPQSLERSDVVTAKAHPLEPWRRIGTELLDLEPGQSPIDALSIVQDEGRVRSETGEPHFPHSNRKANYSPRVDEPAGCPRSPTIMAMTESVLGHGSEEGNASRTQAWVCSELDEETKWQNRIALLRKSWLAADVENDISRRVDGPYGSRENGFHAQSRSEGYNRCPSLNLSDDEDYRHSTQTRCDQIGNEPTWASRLNEWPFWDSALDETRATSKTSPNENIWHDIEESLREIMRASTIKMSPFGTNMCNNLPSRGLADTPEETTIGRFRDRSQCAVVAIHGFMRITQDSLLLLNQTRSLQMFDGTLCNEWESASTRALLTVLAAEISCNEYMNTIIQGEHERLPFTEARIAGDLKKAPRKRARASYDITRKLRGIFSTLDIRLGWLSKDHEEKRERAVREFDAAVEAGLISPAWWRGESKENMLMLENVLIDSL